MFNELSQINFVKQEIPPEIESSMAELFESYKESLVTAAVNASTRGQHWDKERPIPMHVGCGMLILENDFDLSNPKIITGANTKKAPGMLAYPERICAEMDAKNNALKSRDKFNIADSQLQAKGVEIEEGQLQKEGLIAAIVTISPSKNTGEVDTQTHDLVYPCKQCQENYKLLLQKNRASRKTIIYSGRIKDGKVRGEQFELGDLLDLLEKENKDKEKNSLKEIRSLLDNQIKIFLTAIKPIDAKIEETKVSLIQKYGANTSVLSKFLEDLDKERKDEAFAIFDQMKFRSVMDNAIKAVIEEGIAKSKVLFEILPPELVKKIRLDSSRPNLSKIELETIVDILCSHILYLSRHPERYQPGPL